MTTHKHEIAEVIAAGDMKGAINLGMEAIENEDGTVQLTYRVLRDHTAPSLGHILAHKKGLTPSVLRAELQAALLDGRLDVAETRFVPAATAREEDERTVQRFFVTRGKAPE